MVTSTQKCSRRPSLKAAPPSRLNPSRFILSKDGQSQLRNLYRIPSRADLDPLSPKLDPKRLRLLPMSPNLADREDDWKKQFRGIFGIQG